MFDIAYQSSDPQVISNAVLASDLSDDQVSILKYSDKVWSMISQFEPASQSRALFHLKSTVTPEHEPILLTLLQSQNAAVALEAAVYFIDQPQIVLQHLFQFLYSIPPIALNSFELLEQISKNHPKSFEPYLIHFYPPQKNRLFQHLSLQILCNIGGDAVVDPLVQWSIAFKNQTATHFLGKMKNKFGLRQILEKGDHQNAEIAAYYLSKMDDREYFSMLLDSKITPFQVSIFSEICKIHSDLCEQLLLLLCDRFASISRETKSEAILLSARMIDLKGSTKAEQFLTMCEQDPNVSKKAAVFRSLINSGPNFKDVIWIKCLPPPLDVPSIILPNIY